ncbi:unnamed protein product [Gadus morhua 'NCC']
MLECAVPAPVVVITGSAGACHFLVAASDGGARDTRHSRRLSTADGYKTPSGSVISERVPPPPSPQRTSDCIPVSFSFSTTTHISRDTPRKNGVSRSPSGVGAGRGARRW